MARRTSSSKKSLYWAEAARAKAFSAQLNAKAGRCGSAIMDLEDAHMLKGYAQKTGLFGNDWNALNRELYTRTKAFGQSCMVNMAITGVEPNKGFDGARRRRRG